jgi:Ca2+-binding RTX toxin-like protein
VGLCRGDPHVVLSRAQLNSRARTPDARLTADGVFGRAAAKASGAALTAATNWLVANAAGYIDPTGTFGAPFPGSYAGLALVAEVTGRNPHSFGGLDLLSKLRELECRASGRADCAPAERRLFENTV